MPVSLAALAMQASHTNTIWGGVSSSESGIEKPSTLSHFLHMTPRGMGMGNPFQ
jgi:hypothetical protein